jgi:hypothetical protein
VPCGSLLPYEVGSSSNESQEQLAISSKSLNHKSKASAAVAVAGSHGRGPGPEAGSSVGRKRDSLAAGSGSSSNAGRNSDAKRRASASGSGSGLGENSSSSNHGMRLGVSESSRWATPGPVFYPMQPQPQEEEEGSRDDDPLAALDDNCLVCGLGGHLLLCDYPMCVRAYHQVGCLTALFVEPLVCMFRVFYSIFGVYLDRLFCRCAY